MHRLATGSLAPLALLACSGARSPSPPPPGPPPQASAPAPVRWEAFVLPERADPVLVDAEPDGTQHVLAGSVRVSVHGDELTWARDFPLHGIVARARSGDHWLFATRDGLLLRAPSFTGALARVADTGGHPLREGFDSAGILVARDDAQRVWLGGPGDALRLAPAGDGAPWVRATFADGLFGLALLAPGRVLRTTDGGGHFEPLAFGLRAAHALRLQDGAFVVSVSDGAARVEPQGAPVDLPRAPAASDAPDAALSPETVALIRRGYNEPTYPYAYRTLQLDGVVLPDGRVAAFEYTDLVLYGPDGAQARMEAPAEDCEIQLWGAQVLARCREDSRSSFHVTDGMHAWTELRAVDGDYTATASADGTSLVIDGACDGHETTRDESLLCWFDGVTWQTHALRYRATPRALWGETLLYEAPEVNDDDEEERVALYAVRAGENDVDRRVAIEPADAQPASVHFAPSGEVLLTARKNGRVYAAVGDLAHPLMLRPGPVGARVIRFADPSHALAAGTDLAHVWTSSDAGRSWTPLRIPVEGDAGGVATGSAETNSDDGDEPVAVQCVASGCFAGDRLVWAAPYPFPGGAPIQPGRAVAATHTPAHLHDDGDAGREEGEGYQATQWRCEGHHREAAVAPARLYGPGGWIDARFAGPAGRVDGALALAWSGTDERGRFHAAARPGALAPLGTAGDAASHEGLLIPRLITRTLAVFERCTNEGDRGLCDVVVGAAGGPVRALGARGALLPFGTRSVEFVGALALDDGGAALHLGSSHSEGGAGVQGDAVVRLSPRGELAGRREYAWPIHTEVRMLAVGPDGPGLAVSARGDPRDLRMYPMDPAAPSRALPSFAGEHLAVCDGAGGAEPGATTVAVSSRAFGPSVYMGGMLITLYYARPMIEVGARGPCLRGLSFWSWNPRSSTEQALVSDLGGVPQLRATHGALGGVAIDARGNTTLTCTPQ